MKPRAPPADISQRDSPHAQVLFVDLGPSEGRGDRVIAALKTAIETERDAKPH